MGQAFELTGWAAWVALSVPLLLLAFAVAQGTRARRRSPKSPGPETAGGTQAAAPAAPETSIAAPVLLRQTEMAPAAPTAAPRPAPPAAVERTIVSKPPVEPPPAVAPAPGKPAPEPAIDAVPEPGVEPAPDPIAAARETAARLAAEIKAALGAGQESTAVSLYIGEAEALVIAGDRLAAADRLRKSIRLSASLGMKPEHAQARLELGDIARHEGDLTTACEHWSIARSLMHELKKADGIKEAEGRIRNHGCPTDWVLNDF